MKSYVKPSYSIIQLRVEEGISCGESVGEEHGKGKDFGNWKGYGRGKHHNGHGWGFPWHW